MSQTRRSGFTLMELIAVMLLIITVMAMGVPAMFAAERKSYLSQAAQSLASLSKQAKTAQIAAATQGYNLIYKVEIVNPTSQPYGQIGIESGSVPAPLVASSEKAPLDADSFIDKIESVNASGAVITLVSSFKLNPQTGDPDITAPLRYRFSALNGKATRIMTIYPNGFTEESAKP